MDVLADLAALGAPEGTTVVADFQAHGRGRANRSWAVPADTALLHSVLLRPELPPGRLTPLSVLVGEAIVATLREQHDLPAQLKWPNDVLVHKGKIGGVLIQVRGTPPAAIVGVGINANVSADHLPEGGTSIWVEKGEIVDREALMRAFLDQLAIRYQELVLNDLEERWKQVHRVLAFKGERVLVQDGDACVDGQIRGVDTDGALLLDVDGSVRRIMVGDVSRGPRRIDAGKE